MKRYLIFISFFILFCSTVFSSDECKLFVRLSSVSQNFHHSVSVLPEDVGLDESNYTEYIEKLHDVLSQMVAREILVKKELVITDATLVKLSKDKEFNAFTLSLSERYGIYVARDLLDMGSLRRVYKYDSNIMKDEYTFYLPKDDLHHILKILNPEPTNSEPVDPHTLTPRQPSPTADEPRP